MHVLLVYTLYTRRPWGESQMMHVSSYMSSNSSRGGKRKSMCLVLGTRSHDQEKQRHKAVAEQAVWSQAENLSIDNKLAECDNMQSHYQFVLTLRQKHYDLTQAKW